MDPHCFDADADPKPYPDPAQNLDADPYPDPDPGGGGVGQPKNVHPPWQNPRYAPGSGFTESGSRLLLYPDPDSDTWVLTKKLFFSYQKLSYIPS